MWAVYVNGERWRVGLLTEFQERELLRVVQRITRETNATEIRLTRIQKEDLKWPTS